MKTVGAAFVPTAGGRETLRAAAQLARSAGARLVAVMVLDPKDAEEQSPGLMAAAHHDQDASEDVAGRERIAAEDALREALAGSATDLDAEPDVLFQDPDDGLIRLRGASTCWSWARPPTVGGRQWHSAAAGAT